MTDETVADLRRPSWRELAVARSLDPARARAEKRVQRFLDAALELMTQARRARSSPSRRSSSAPASRCGASTSTSPASTSCSLALFEESVRSTAEHLEEVVEGATIRSTGCRSSPASTTGCAALPTASDANSRPPTASAMADFAQQLLTQHPEGGGPGVRAARVDCSCELLDEAAAAGVIRSGLDHRRITGVVLQAVMFNAFADTISGRSVRPEPAKPPTACGDCSSTASAPAPAPEALHLRLRRPARRARHSGDTRTPPRDRSRHDSRGRPLR